MFSFNRLALAGLVGALVSHTAVAADMSFGMAPPPPLDEARVELGSGWYLRGDVGWARENTPTYDSNLQITTNAQSVNGWVLGLGVGYKFNNWLRGDITYDVRNSLKETASTPHLCVTAVSSYVDAGGTAVGWLPFYDDCTERRQASLKRQSLLLNGYVDLGTWSRVTPYVGAGVGATMGKEQINGNWYQSNGAEYAPDIQVPAGPPVWYGVGGVPTTPAAPVVFGPQNKRVHVDRTAFNFTWALMAGVAYDVSANAKVDLGYRYVNMGRFGQGVASDVSTVHEYRVGLRYMID